MSSTRLLALAAALVAGCRAGAAVQDDASGPDDLAVTPDLATPPDLSGPDLSCPYSPTEICGDGCDNDGDGYVDNDDPDCQPIVIAGLSAGDALRWNLSSGLAPFLPLAPWTGAAAYRHDIVPGEAWVTRGGISGKLQRYSISTGKKTLDLSLSYLPRDVCFFGGNVIVAEEGASTGVLHVLKPDGTETKTVAVAEGAPAACASDGQLLYVPVHVGTNRSQFVVFDGNLAETAPRPIPPALTEDRCLDLAWTKDGFYGLFVLGNNMPDTNLSASYVYPFAMDGGVGAPVALPDAGGLQVHSLGEFVP